MKKLRFEALWFPDDCENDTHDVGVHDANTYTFSATRLNNRSFSPFSFSNEALTNVKRPLSSLLSQLSKSETK